jgi:hypothetical protein
MFKRILASVGVSAVLFSALSADNVFPSPVNPAGLPADQVPQLAALIFDDNAYSGLTGTMYEADEPSVESGKEWNEKSFVGGQYPWGTGGAPNDLNIEEGDMGMSWAIQTLGQNGDVPLTFNPITGLFLPIWGPEWTSRESEFGYFEPSDPNADHDRIPISWGREMRIGTSGPTDSVEGGQIGDVFRQAEQMGHEIGNHTVDHLEANSPLPLQQGSDPYGSESVITGQSNVDGFSAWKQAGDDWWDYGFSASHLQEMPWGETIDLTERFDMGEDDPGANMGWGVYAGKYISQEAWSGLIKLGEDVLVDEGGVSRDKIKGFRAPRLEINSNQFFALAEAGYLWDGGSEEGYEYHRDGTNFLWPYTVDNGSLNAWTQHSRGNRRSVDSMPVGSGLWNLHTNAIIVPENIREEVYHNHAEILRGAPDADAPSPQDSTHWVNENGKITAYDFNTWIMWGMTAQNWQTSMRHTMELRLEGQKAPFHFGMHTDYHTPVYDNATLLTDFNKPGYGLNVTEGWNEWDDRTSETESFVSWAQSNGVDFVTGTQLVEAVADIANQAPDPFTAKPADDLEFVFIRNDKLNSEASQASFEGSFDGHVVVDAEQNGQAPWATFNAYNMTVEQLNYISLDYKTNSAIAVVLNIKDEADRQVILSNANTSGMVSSGLIPLWAFDYDQYVDVDPDHTGEMVYGRDAIDVSKITGIEIKPLAPENDENYETRSEPYQVDFAVENLVLYGDYTQGSVSIADKDHSVSVSDLALNSLTRDQLNLNISESGNYSVTIATASGRIVTSISNHELAQGANAIELNNLASGVYMVNVHGIDTNQSLTQRAFIR